MFNMFYYGGFDGDNNHHQNLTSFEIVLPPSAVPDGSRYALSYLLYKFRDNGTIDTYYPTFSVFSSNRC